jgi:sterol desaturase/sphingolipid hydroxylase (fatty acid hydroxylase superfamily)
MIAASLFVGYFCRDNFILLQALIASMACYIDPPFIENVPLWNAKGFIIILSLHVGISEPLYYWVHRCFHESYLFNQYHSIHHSSPVLHPFTGKNKANIHICMWTEFLLLQLHFFLLDNEDI